MNIGFVGLGKLGLPCALAIEQKGHTVLAVDPSPAVHAVLEQRSSPHYEANQAAALAVTRIRIVDLVHLVKESDIIFIAVQTPHDPRYEGITPLPAERVDFDYQYLVQAVDQLCGVMAAERVTRNVAIISTVLPGTMASRVRPVIEQHRLAGRFRLVYNPFFIAMGTAMQDFLHPEFSLIGLDDPEAATALQAFYRTIHDRPQFVTTVENAELIKVTYNVMIGTKIVLANAIMEICHKTPNTDCDRVVDALTLATDRIISSRYMRGGAGDGGGCHPRDCIAMSWLARNLVLSHDVFDDLMTARDDQTAWLGGLIVAEHKRTNLPIVLLGQAYKPNSDITVGSPARLLAHVLATWRHHYQVFDPIAGPVAPVPVRPAVFFVATKHDCWRSFEFPAHSVVLDPFRYLQGNNSLLYCQYRPIGVGPKAGT